MLFDKFAVDDLVLAGDGFVGVVLHDKFAGVLGDFFV